MIVKQSKKLQKNSKKPQKISKKQAIKIKLLQRKQMQQKKVIRKQRQSRKKPMQSRRLPMKLQNKLKIKNVKLLPKSNLPIQKSRKPKATGKMLLRILGKLSKKSGRSGKLKMRRLLRLHYPEPC